MIVELDEPAFELLVELAGRWLDSCRIDLRLARSWTDAPVPGEILLELEQRIGRAERLVRLLEEVRSPA